jgi:hypothetical protein
MFFEDKNHEVIGCKETVGNIQFKDYLKAKGIEYSVIDLEPNNPEGALRYKFKCSDYKWNIINGSFKVLGC